MSDAVLEPLSSGEIRISRRPGVIALLYAFRLVLALIIAWPLARLATTLTGGQPRSDALLFDPGALFLIDALRLAQQGLLALARAAALLGLLASLLGVLPLAGLLVALAHRGRFGFAELLGAAARHFWSFLILLAAATVASIGVVFLASIVTTLLDGKVEGRAGAPYAILFRLLVILAAGVALATIAIAHDLSRVAVVLRREAPLRAVQLGLSLLRAHPKEALGGWGWRAAGSAGAIGLGAAVMWWTGVESTARVALAWCVHQAVVVSLLTLRASWLACALRLVRAQGVTSEDPF